MIGEAKPLWLIQAYWSKRNLGDASLPREMDGSALQNAASIAALVLTTEAVVGEIPEEKPAVPAMPGMPGGMM